MNTIKSKASLSSILLGASLLAGIASGCGVEVRPKVPTLQAHAVITPASFEAETDPAPEPVAPANASVHAGSSAPAFAPGPANDSPPALPYARSGGSSAASAEAFVIGNTIVGRVTAGAPRYYWIDLVKGDEVELKSYARTTGAPSAFTLMLLEPDEVKLAGGESFVMARGDWERDIGRATVKQSGRHLVRVSTRRHTMEFKFVLHGPGPAVR